MKSLLLLFITLILLPLVSYTQNTCICRDTFVRASPLFTHLLESPNPIELSRDFLAQYLNENISAANLEDDIMVEAETFIGQDGKFCDIKYDKTLSIEAQNHIASTLKKMPILKNTCFSIKRSIIINPYIKAGEDIFKVASNMPIFNGCKRKMDNEKSNECTVEKLENYIYSHPLYHKLTMQQGTYVVNFVITKEGKTTLFSTKRGDFDGNEDKVKQIIYDMPLWQPGNQRGENVNILYTIPIKIR